MSAQNEEERERSLEERNEVAAGQNIRNRGLGKEFSLEEVLPYLGRKSLSETGRIFGWGETAFKSRLRKVCIIRWPRVGDFSFLKHVNVPLPRIQPAPPVRPVPVPAPQHVPAPQQHVPVEGIVEIRVTSKTTKDVVRMSIHATTTLDELTIKLKERLLLKKPIAIEFLDAEKVMTSVLTSADLEYCIGEKRPTGTVNIYVTETGQEEVVQVND